MTIFIVLKNTMSLKIFFRLSILILLFFFIQCKSYASNLNNIETKELKKILIIHDNYYLKNNKNNDKIIEIISRKNNKIKNYLFYTNDLSNIMAYSGKPLELLIMINLIGIIENIKLIKHSEPILLIGIPIEKLLEAIAFYKNKNVNKKLNIGGDITGEMSIPIIAGATVTSLILHETILESTRTASNILNITTFNKKVENKFNNTFQKFTWEELLKIGAIKHYSLDKFLNTNNKKEDLLIDIYFADIKHPSIGKNLFGDYYYDIFDNLNKHDSAIIILNKGSWSFKGSGFVRGGIYDRFRIEQNNNIFTFRDSSFQNIYDINLINLDDFKEYGIFIIKNNKYKPYLPWNLTLLLNYKTFNIQYKSPEIFYKKQSTGWIKSWENKIYYISLFIILWSFVIVVFITRNFLAKKNFFLSAIYNLILLLDIYLIGILLESQPSIVNIFSLIDNIKNIETFLFDPFISLSWIMIISTIFIWGKALFCGWICPFGALQELIFKTKLIFFKNAINIEFKIFYKLKYMKYIILILLILLSLINLHKAELAAEIEPFKTIWIIGLLNRPFYISLYTILILFVSIFTYRFFCRFICPLGALLSFLSFFTLLKLKRRGTCSVCKICKKNCNSNAIDNFGKIDTKECFGCFNCISTMYNKNICPPIKNKKLREKYEKNILW